MVRYCPYGPSSRSALLYSSASSLPEGEARSFSQSNQWTVMPQSRIKRKRSGAGSNSNAFVCIYCALSLSKSWFYSHHEGGLCELSRAAAAAGQCEPNKVQFQAKKEIATQWRDCDYCGEDRIFCQAYFKYHGPPACRVPYKDANVQGTRAQLPVHYL
jgi:hypothetical protein